jgi:hypothetical protein
LLEYKQYAMNTPEFMHELIWEIAVHAHNKSSVRRVQQIGIYYRFNIAVPTAIADNQEYGKKRLRSSTQPFKFKKYFFIVFRLWSTPNHLFKYALQQRRKYRKAQSN